MRQIETSKKDSDRLMEIDDLSKLKEEPHHLSGACICSLVKQLTSSRTKDTMNPKDLKFREGFSEAENRQQQPQQHKKQVRRRLHTSRPYQERLLNMAEARREIVTALKFHRAAMKQASEQQQQQQHQEQEQQPQQSQQLPPQSHSSYSEPEGRINSRSNPRINPSNSSNYYETLPYPSNFYHQYPSVLNQFFGIPAPPLYENFDFAALPSQTLGLNLNFQDFNNINTTLYHNSSSPSFPSTSGSASFSASASASASSPSSSTSPSLSVATDHEVPGSSISQMEIEAPAAADADDSCITTSSGDGLRVAMDDGEMAEIRSIGEQHQMEWNDTMNLVTSAWWSKFLKGEDHDDDGYKCNLPYDEVLEFPTWLNANEGGSFQQHLNDYYSADYFQDPALPCMDIGEFECFDGEWLA